MLSKDKLINIVPDKGAFVSKPSADEAREVYAVRRILETALAREFTARARPADFRRIEAHLARERQALESGDAQARNRLLGDFHLLLAEIVGNQVLTDMLRELLARSAVITALYQSTHDAGCSSREHRAFIQAARKGDADAASALMDEHLRHVLDALISRPARKATPTWSPRCCADAPSPRPLDPAQGAAPASRYSVTCSRRPPDAASGAPRGRPAPRARNNHTHAGRRHMYKHILIPTDGSALSNEALVRSLQLAKTFGAAVTILTVEEPFHVFSMGSAQLAASLNDYQDQIRAQAERLLNDAAAQARELGLSCETLRVSHEDPYQAIIDAAAKRGCDLIAMASHGRRGMAAVVLGSQTQKVLTHSTTPVLVYRKPS